MQADNSSSKPDSGYETVFTVTDYYDGPRGGVANYLGKPHLYECEFDGAQDDYSDRYLLTPISEETFRLALEDWEIWKRWESAYHAGKADISSHPALPDDRARHEELRLILDKELVTDTHKAIVRIGKFEAVRGQDLPRGVIRPLRVKWSESE